jgi:chromosomal replication initiator protein
MRHDVLFATVEAPPAAALSAYERIRRDLERKFVGGDYKSYLEPLRLLGQSDGSLVFLAPYAVGRDWVQSHAAHVIEALLSEHLRLEGPIVIKAEQELPEGGRSLFHGGADVTPLKEDGAHAGVGAGVAPLQSFDSFCVGASNRAAYMTLKAIAEGAGGAFPLVLLHGPPGVGKSHLMNACAHEALRLNPNRRVRYMMSQIFIEEFQAALHKRKDISMFKALVRENDLFLLDDVHRIAGKKATEEEFLDTITVILSLGGQVVVSADHGAQGLMGFDERVRTQMRGATEVMIGEPDFELRRKIVESRVALYRQAHPDFAPPASVIDMIAARVAASGRELDGAVRQLLMSSMTADGPISHAGAEQALKAKFADPERKRPTVDLIIKTTARVYGMTPQELLARTRQQAIARPRQIAMYLCTRMTTRSLPDIARRFGGFDHTTVLYARDRIAAMVERDATFRTEVEGVMRAVREGL